MISFSNTVPARFERWPSGEVLETTFSWRSLETYLIASQSLNRGFVCNVWILLPSAMSELISEIRSFSKTSLISIQTNSLVLESSSKEKLKIPHEEQNYESHWDLFCRSRLPFIGDRISVAETENHHRRVISRPKWVNDLWRGLYLRDLYLLKMHRSRIVVNSKPNDTVSYKTSV